MKKVIVNIPYDQVNIPNDQKSTYFKTNTTKIKRIPDGETSHNHIFVGENEFMEFLNNPTGISNSIQIISIENNYTQSSNSIATILNASAISAIINKTEGDNES